MDREDLKLTDEERTNVKLALKGNYCQSDFEKALCQAQLDKVLNQPWTVTLDMAIDAYSRQKAIVPEVKEE